MVITYRTDLDALRAVVPEALQLSEPLVKFEFIRMPGCAAFGDYAAHLRTGAPLRHASHAAPRLDGAWTGSCSPELHPHALAPLAELPVLQIVSCLRFRADLGLGLGLGEVAYDYLK